MNSEIDKEQEILDEYQEYLDCSALENSEILICECYSVSNLMIKELLVNGPELTFQEICTETKMTRGCGSCYRTACHWFKEYKIN